jgi:hypothetical protein
MRYSALFLRFSAYEASSTIAAAGAESQKQEIETTNRQSLTAKSHFLLPPHAYFTATSSKPQAYLWQSLRQPFNKPFHPDERLL